MGTGQGGVRAALGRPIREQFASLDYDRNAGVSRAEAHGNVDLTAAFDDMDIDRNGVVTKAALDRFLTLR